LADKGFGADALSEMQRVIDAENSDKFTDSGSGWSTGTTSSGTSEQYGPVGFVIKGVGDLGHFDLVPWPTTYDQVAMSTTATQSGNMSSSTGFGVACERGPQEALYYEFMLYTDGGWSIQRGLCGELDTLMTGSGAPHAGATPVTVRAVCMKVDNSTVRLVMAIDGQNVADMTDAPSTLPLDGWRPAIGCRSSSADTAAKPVVVTYVDFEEWDLMQ
jgi:hypothetical protein